MTAQHLYQSLDARRLAIQRIWFKATNPQECAALAAAYENAAARATRAWFLLYSAGV